VRRHIKLARAEWPVLAQLAGLVAVCFAIGFLAGTAWAVLTGGIALIGVGALVESDEDPIAAFKKAKRS
jgi:hypothetical protein